MITVTFTLEEEIARQIEERARIEQMSLSDWVALKIRSSTQPLPSARKTSEYPEAWWKLFGSVNGDAAFQKPDRGPARSIENFDLP